MFRKSPYLDNLPVISVDLSRLSAYRLREAQAAGQYCTAEVAIALLDMASDTGAAAGLGSILPALKHAIWQEKRNIWVASQQNS